MTAIVESRARFELIQRHMDAATLALCRDDLGAVQRLCQEALETLEAVSVCFRPDWLALDSAISTVATARSWAQRKSALAEPGRQLEPLLSRALELRLRWLDGDEA